MIASGVYTWEHTLEALAELGCKQVEGEIFKGQTQDYCLMETPWGHQFMVPMRAATDWELRQIIERDINGTQPTYN